MEEKSHTSSLIKFSYFGSQVVLDIFDQVGFRSLVEMNCMERSFWFWGSGRPRCTLAYLSCMDCGKLLFLLFRKIAAVFNKSFDWGHISTQACYQQSLVARGS